MYQSVFKRENLQQLIKNVSPSCVLDIGCSNSALDQSTHVIDYIDHSKIYPEKICIVQDLNKNPTLPFGDSTFDFVYCSHVLEHLDDPLKILKEIERVGKEGAIIVPTKLEDNLYSIDAIKDGDEYITDRYGHKWWFDYGLNATLEVSARKRVVRRLPQSENEVKSLRQQMPNLFELCIHWKEKISFEAVEFSNFQNNKPVRLGVSDLGIFIGSALKIRDAISDTKETTYKSLIKKDHKTTSKTLTVIRTFNRLLKIIQLPLKTFSAIMKNNGI